MEDCIRNKIYVLLERIAPICDPGAAAHITQAVHNLTSALMALDHLRQVRPPAEKGE